ncbi:transmembrane protein 135-like [Halichondria panicea]|uniref:transmembrane protein 135-like n=1 Tax=Halichondria panicea TaxID=6063 RepID=UPI00312BB8EC
MQHTTQKSLSFVLHPAARLATMVLFSRPSQWLYVRGSCHELGHTWHPSCMYSCCEMFMFVFLEALKVYIPLYLLSNITRLRDLRWVLMSLLPNILRSSLFLGANGGGFVGFICLNRHVLGGFYKYTAAFVPAFLASLCTIFIERKNRRRLLLGYMSTMAAEAVYSVLKAKGKINGVPYGEVMIFSLASAVLLHRQCTSKVIPTDTVGSVISGLLRPSLPSPMKLPFSGMAANLLWVGLWGFSCGYLIRFLLSLLTYWRKLVKSTANLKELILKKQSLKFGLFLASFSTWFKLSNWLMKVLAVPQDLRLIISGLIAGLSMVFVRSPVISLYAGWKALEVLYFKAVEKGYAKSWYYGDAVLFSISTAIVFHSLFFDAHHLREAYFKFIDRVTRGRILLMNYEVIDQFGTNASLRPMQLLREHSAKDK